MIVERKEYIDPDDTLGYVETIFNSSNILMSIYFPKTSTLFISFNNGHTYQYDNVTKEIYDEFENAESQGKYFNTKIRNKKEFPYIRKYSLYDNEIKQAKKQVNEWKEKNQQEKNS